MHDQILLLESQTAAPSLVAEAVALSLEEIGEKIRVKLNPPRDGYPSAEEMPYCWVRATYDDRVVVEKSGKLWEIAYTVGEDGDVMLGEPAEVVVTYQRIAESGATVVTYERVAPSATVDLHETQGHLLEAAEKTGSTWRVLLIRSGTSGNGIHYSPDVLKEAVPLFEGVKAYADHPSRDEMRSRPERSIRDVVGWYDNVAYDDAHAGIAADFHVLESADWLRTMLRSAWDAGKGDLLGFSINAAGTKTGKRKDGGALLEAIVSVTSTDVVTTPGAGGRLLGMLESERSAGVRPEGEMDPEEIKRLIREAMAAGLTELQAQLQTQLAEALREARGSTAVADPPAAALPAAPEPLKEVQDELAALRRERRIGQIGARIDAAQLPAAHALKLKTRLTEAAARRDVDDAEVDAEIAFVRELILESGVARPAWAAPVKVGDSAHDKMVKSLQGWFDGAPVDGVPAVRDLRESYAHWNGQAYLDVEPYSLWRSFATRYDSAGDHARLRESLGTSDWGQVFADVFYLQMIKSYADSPDYDKWRLIVSDIESVPDFRTRHWARVGGYGDFSSVAERGTYPTLTSPGDEEVAYAVAKYGGIDDISLEMILGDRLQIVRRLPRLMAYAAARTLYKFVFNLATTTNPTMDYDSVALYDSSHANTGTTALSVAGMSAVKVAMRSQRAFGQSAEILGTRNAPKILIVPNELEDRAMRIVNPSDAYATALASSTDSNTELDPHTFKNSGIVVHVYDELADATDWWVVADPTKVPTIVMGFLNGRTEPELFTQDQANVGSAFTADKISYKVRHVFGGEVQEHRSFYRQVVSGS